MVDRLFVLFKTLEYLQILFFVFYKLEKLFKYFMGKLRLFDDLVVSRIVVLILIVKAILLENWLFVKENTCF